MDVVLKNKSITKLLLISLLSTLNLFGAQSGLYVELSGGANLEEKIKTKKSDYIYEKGYLATAAIGYQLEELKFELEYIYIKNELYGATNSGSNNISAEGDLVQNSQMANIYYSGYNESKFVSTIGLGVGISSLNIENLKELEYPQSDIKDTAVLSYQGIFSIGYMYTKNTTLSVKYKYFATTESDNFESHSDNLFSLSLRYLF